MKRKRPRVQTLGGQSYALPDVVLDNTNVGSIHSSWSLPRKIILYIILSPLWLIWIVIYNVVLLLLTSMIPSSMMSPWASSAVSSSSSSSSCPSHHHYHGDKDHRNILLRVYHKILVRWVIPWMSRYVHVMTWNQRKILLQRIRGRVLVVEYDSNHHNHIGSGCRDSYMNLLPPSVVTHVVVLEPNPECQAILREHAQQAGFAPYQVTIHSETLEDYCINHHYHHHDSMNHDDDDHHHHLSNDMKGSNSLSSSVLLFDWIILGNFLCQVSNVNKALDDVHRILKPAGGMVYFQEHIGYPSGSWKRRIQNIVNPWWKRISGGCHCNRDSWYALEGMEEWDLIVWEMRNVSLIPWMGPMVMGLARKATTNDLAVVV